MSPRKRPYTFRIQIYLDHQRKKEDAKMYGALLGDMIGAPYEFDRGKGFPDVWQGDRVYR